MMDRPIYFMLFKGRIFYSIDSIVYIYFLLFSFFLLRKTKFILKEFVVEIIYLFIYLLEQIEKERERKLLLYFLIAVIN